MLKRIFALLLVLFFIVSCASTPKLEGFDKAKTDAYEAQKKALNIGADKEVPASYTNSETSLKMAEDKETAGNLEEAMSLFKEATRQFNLAISETNKKRSVDAYVKETEPLLEELDKKISELEY